MDQLPRLGKTELICLLCFICNYVVSVRRGFFFLWVLGMGLPYNYLLYELATKTHRAFVYKFVVVYTEQRKESLHFSLKRFPNLTQTNFFKTYAYMTAARLTWQPYDNVSKSIMHKRIALIKR